MDILDGLMAAILDCMARSTPSKKDIHFIMLSISESTLRAVAPLNSGIRKNHQDAIVKQAAPVMQDQFPAAGLDTPDRIAHFLAQICEESDGFCTVEEYASGAAYEGRKDMGNIMPGDGVRFKGRGLIQITGRYNYALYGASLSLPLLTQPGLAAIPENAVKIATAFWTKHNLNAFADADDIESITKRINGGLNGLATRKIYLARAKKALAPPVQPAPLVA